MGTTTGEILHNPDSRDHFEVLGLPRRLLVDERQLSDHYYRLSRLYHPDFYQTASPAERVASLRRTAAINDAYKTLRDPVARGRWWLEHHGRKLGEDSRVPPDLIELVFEAQELLEQAARSNDSSLAPQIRARRAEAQAARQVRMERLMQNFAKWDAQPDERQKEALLEELREVLAEISYIETILENMDRTLERMGA